MENGWFADYEFYVSENGTDWGTPVVKGKFVLDNTQKIVNFEKPVRGRYLKLVALSGRDNKPYAAIAEFDVISAKPKE
jgi:hypothetical protein